jgi:junctophilin
MEPSFSDIKPSAGGGLDGLGLEGHHASKNGTGNGAANGAGLDFKLPAEDQIRFRGVQQEIPHFGAPPKRTESLYMKPGEAAQPQLKAVGNSAMQRKKSLPDVAALPTVTVKQGSQAMTREEISVLSSARREEIRRQLDEAERYRANPVLYIFNPHIREWFSRQQLMMVVLFVNVTLAIMFFKLLT